MTGVREIKRKRTSSGRGGVTKDAHNKIAETRGECRAAIMSESGPPNDEPKIAKCSNLDTSESTASSNSS